jgi:hypothetical protein
VSMPNLSPVMSSSSGLSHMSYQHSSPGINSQQSQAHSSYTQPDSLTGSQGGTQLLYQTSQTSADGSVVYHATQPDGSQLVYHAVNLPDGTVVYQSQPVTQPDGTQVVYQTVPVAQSEASALIYQPQSQTHVSGSDAAMQQSQHHGSTYQVNPSSGTPALQHDYATAAPGGVAYSMPESSGTSESSQPFSRATLPTETPIESSVKATREEPELMQSETFISDPVVGANDMVSQVAQAEG